MKITVGKRPVRAPSSPADTYEINRAIVANIVRGVMAEVVDVSPSRLRKLRGELQLVATEEALQLFPNIVHLIDGATEGLHMGGERIDWKPLTPAYRRYKDRYASGRTLKRSPRATRADIRRAQYRTDRHFLLSGDLRAYFYRNGRSIVQNRFGGVEVEFNSTSRDRSLTTLFSPQFDRELRTSQFRLGEFHIKIFPRIAPGLMPMMTSRRWSDTSPRATFERAMLPAGAAKKLSGGRGPYRPLVQPLVQFWIINRIPGALNRQLQRAIRTTIKSGALQ